MAERLKIIAALPPRYIINNPHPGCETAHMAYSVGRGFRLYRAREMANASGGFMVLEIGRFQGGGPSASIVDNVVSECERREFKGVVLDADGRSKTAVTMSLAHSLAAALQKKELLLFVPEDFYTAGENMIIRLSTALSGGTLIRHLSDCTEKYGAKNVAVEIERVRMDFNIPSLSGVGKELSPAGLEKLTAKRSGKLFYSPELATNYFMHRENGQPGFVLFDDADSIKKKLSVVRNADIRFAFVYYPQVMDILDDILTF